MGFIWPTWSSSGSPVLFAQKKDSSLQLCVDFHSLNKITKMDWYPLPWISDLLDSPCKARLFSHIDLWHAYHLVRICKGDEWKTAFWTHYSSFEWCVMPFGLTNSPATFNNSWTTVLVTSLMFASSFTWMTSSSTLMIPISIMTTSVKCSDTSENIIYTHAPTNAFSIDRQLNTSDTSCPRMDLPWTPRKLMSYKIGLNHENLKMFNPFSDSPTFTNNSFPITLI